MNTIIRTTALLFGHDHNVWDELQVIKPIEDFILAKIISRPNKCKSYMSIKYIYLK